MKKYICINHGECNWADEKPPREFTLSTIDENVCPNCGSINIKEKPTPSGPPWPKIAMYITGFLLIVGILYLIFREPSVISERNNGGSPTDSSGSSTKRVNDDNTTEGHEEEKGREKSHKQTVPIKWARVAGSEFCVGDCIVAYTETDNLGHTRERRIENYEKCCPADK